MDRFEALEIEGIEPKKEELDDSPKPPCFGYRRVGPDAQCAPTCQWAELCIAASPDALKAEPDCYGKDKDFIVNNGANIICPWECAWSKKCHKLSKQQYADSTNKGIIWPNTAVMEGPNVTPPPMPPNYTTGIGDGLDPPIERTRADANSRIPSRQLWPASGSPVVNSVPPPVHQQLFPPPRAPVENPVPPSGPPVPLNSGWGTPPVTPNLYSRPEQEPAEGLQPPESTTSPLSLEYTARYGPASRGTMAAQAELMDSLQRKSQTHNVVCPLYSTDYDEDNVECLDCRSSRACNFHTNLPASIADGTKEDRVKRSFVSYGIVKMLLILTGGSVILALLLGLLLRG